MRLLLRKSSPDFVTCFNVARNKRDELTWNIYQHLNSFHVRHYSSAVPGNSEKPPIEELTKLKQANLKLTESVKTTEDKYIRALAEAENVRQRMMKQVGDAKQFGIQGFCKDLLSVADTLRLASENIPAEHLENTVVKSMHEGLKLTESQLMQVFEKHGVKLLHPEGQKFDPNFHEAVFQQSMPEKEAGTIFVVTKPGYTLNERVLRPALVGVVKQD
ncbi:Roe1 [Bugula neritina]|uniref:GrpE protein homolog n=1 Tax=Bugula neritina TaxID=10212 RepID=A0A7J7K342_BUGNE|nr:Roe1 [Bugula neritina]